MVRKNQLKRRKRSTIIFNDHTIWWLGFAFGIKKKNDQRDRRGESSASIHRPRPCPRAAPRRHRRSSTPAHLREIAHHFRRRPLRCVIGGREPEASPQQRTRFNYRPRIRRRGPAAASRCARHSPWKPYESGSGLLSRERNVAAHTLTSQGTVSGLRRPGSGPAASETKGHHSDVHGWAFLFSQTTHLDKVSALSATRAAAIRPPAEGRGATPDWVPTSGSCGGGGGAD